MVTETINIICKHCYKVTALDYLYTIIFIFTRFKILSTSCRSTMNVGGYNGGLCI